MSSLGISLNLSIGAFLKICCPIILTHNHPSGNPNPSIHDDNLTKKIKSACELMDIRQLDHIIVTPYDCFYFYCNNGIP